MKPEQGQMYAVLMLCYIYNQQLLLMLTEC